LLDSLLQEICASSSTRFCITKFLDLIQNESLLQTLPVVVQDRVNQATVQTILSVLQEPSWRDCWVHRPG